MNYHFRKLKLADAYRFSKWGKHEDVRYYQYNFPFETEREYFEWYVMKQRLIRKKVYGLFDERENPVGFITLKNIRWLKRMAELGIGIDPNHLGEGLGRQLITSFLDYVFKHFPIDIMTLRVASFNTRAQRCYRACGFRTVVKKTEPFEEQSFRDEVIRQYPDQFVLNDDVLYADFFLMKIDRDYFYANNPHLASS
ncbi:MAG: diamine N-acetyltransferase [Clostridiales bacterium]|nr:diamine N-acetyltransferase [Clostridiales bacterium]MDN5299220.1 diamine N-acetyltransferase [Clostridiales bacterium]